MCNFLLTLYPSAVKDEIVALINQGSYAKPFIVALESGDPELEKNPALKYLEIVTKTRSLNQRSLP